MNNLDIEKISEQINKLNDYNIEDSKGCQDCPLLIEEHYNLSPNGVGSKATCLKYGSVWDYGYQGYCDHIIGRGDGTERLPQCEITQKEVKLEKKKHLHNKIDHEIFSNNVITRRLKGLKEKL